MATTHSAKTTPERANAGFIISRSKKPLTLFYKSLDQERSLVSEQVAVNGMQIHSVIRRN